MSYSLFNFWSVNKYLIQTLSHEKKFNFTFYANSYIVINITTLLQHVIKKEFQLEPKYREMYIDMKQKITTGIWQENMLMPTEADLCRMYSVSRITTRHALEDLEKEGLVLKLQGRGTFVKGKKLQHGERQKGFVQIMAEQGYIITTKVLVKEEVRAEGEAAERLHLNDGDPVYHFRRLRYIGKTPIVLMDAYVPKALGDEMIKYDLENISFYRLYRDIMKEDIEDSPCTITAFIPDDEICTLLNAEKNSAQLLFKAVAIMPAGPIEYCRSVFNAEYNEFIVSMRDQRIYKTPQK